MKLNKYLNESKNDIYDQLMDLLETMNNATKMVGVRFSVDGLNIKSKTTKDFRNMIIKLNQILNAFHKNTKFKN